MSLQCGIVGLPNVGKSTLFNALSNAKAQSANFPFCTIEPNIGTITVPDERLVELEKLVNPQQVVPTTIEIVDIAGLVKGASKGEGLGNQFLSNIRNTDAIIHVLRCFEDDNITHVDGDVDPIRDKETIDLELIFKDLDSIEKRIDKFRKVAKSGDKEALKSVDFLNNLKAYLEEGKAARGFEMTKEEFALISDLNLLTMKPVLYVCNVGENSVVEGNAHTKRVEEIVKEENAEMLLISAAMEADIAGLDSFEDRQMFLEEMGLTVPGVHRLIQSSYKLLNLITYFTAGEKELRAWTVKKESTAPQAAGVIHTDFEKGFIRAEVIPYNSYIEHGSEAAVKEAGKMNVEGKEYIVQDGDVMHFRHNV